MNSNKTIDYVRHLLRWLCGIITIGLFILCWHLIYAPALHLGFASPVSTLFMLLYAVSTVTLYMIYGAFNIGKVRVSELTYSLTLTNLIANAFSYVLILILHQAYVKLWPMLALCAVQFLWNVAWSMLANRLYFKLHKPRVTAVIYRTEQDLEKLGGIHFFSDRFHVIRHICDPHDAPELLKELEGCEAVFVTGIDPALRNPVAQHCVEKNLFGYFLPEVSELIMSGAEHMQMFSVPVMRITRAQPGLEYRMLKRAMDIGCSLLALIVLSPVMLVTALFIKAYDGGPAFYKQVRLTQNGRHFEILKFRSMNINAEKDGVARLASQGDSRITPVGRIIRSCRIDELPQLINILKGDMTIVGPRPERPEIASEYEKEMPSFALRLQVKAGLTGLAQIYGRYNTDPLAKLQMDLMYINKMSFAEDIKLIFATVKVLFMRESTQGIGTDQTTALQSDHSKGQSV